MLSVDLEGKEYYRVNYPNYTKQNPIYKLHYYSSMVHKFAPARECLNVLDIGCAFGDFISGLPQDWRRVGMDANAFAIHAAKERHPSVEFRLGNSIPSDLTNLDVVTAFDVLEHIPDLNSMLIAIRKSLSDDGILFAVVPVYDGPLGGIVRALDHDVTHVHKNSRRWWTSTLRSYFDIVSVDGVFRWLVPKVQRYIHCHSGALRSVSPAVAIVATKRVT